MCENFWRSAGTTLYGDAFFGGNDGGWNDGGGGYNSGVEEFLLENIFWVALAAVSAGGAAWTTLRAAAAALEPPGAALFAKQTGAVFLDVRPADEFAVGHIAGAKNIPAAELAEKLERIGKYKEKGVVLVCGDGAQSKRSVSALAAGGFVSSRLRVLAGGMAAWRDAQLPLSKGRRG